MSEHILLLLHPRTIGYLDNLTTMFKAALGDLGFTTQISYEIPAGFNGRALIVGSGHLFSEFELSGLSNDLIIFNTENSRSHWITDEYRRILNRFVAWDYSEENAADLSKQVGREIYYLKMFYVEEQTRIVHSAEKSIDVLFYGEVHERRLKVLEGLRNRGLAVEFVRGVFGADLDELISRSKVVLNMHYFEPGRLEMIRIFDLLANRVAVVSELNADERINPDLKDAIVAAPYDQLIDVAESLVRTTGKVESVAAAGFEAFRKREAKKILGDAIAWSAQPRLPKHVIVGSGKSYDQGKLNIDVNEKWHPDIVASISDVDLLCREFSSRRFGNVRLTSGSFDSISASHVLEHIEDLVMAMTNCITLLAPEGLFYISVPYDLSYGAWQDPTHVRAMNERSWLYYCEWYWYIGWTEARFDLVKLSYTYSDLGNELAARGLSHEEILRTPRAVDEMHAVLKKRLLTEPERSYGETVRGDARA